MRTLPRVPKTKKIKCQNYVFRVLCGVGGGAGGVRVGDCHNSDVF